MRDYRIDLRIKGHLSVQEGDSQILTLIDIFQDFSDDGWDSGSETLLETLLNWWEARL